MRLLGAKDRTQDAEEGTLEMKRCIENSNRSSMNSPWGNASLLFPRHTSIVSPCAAGQMRVLTHTVKGVSIKSLHHTERR